MMICGSWGSGIAQSAHFAGVESVVASSGLSNPQQVAVDSAGAVYVVDTGNNRILKETPLATGYQESTIASTGLNSPGGVAIDASGNVYIADSGNNRVVVAQKSGSTYIQSVIPITGLSNPSGIAVDASGNLYISDYGNARVVKETLTGSNYTQSVVESGMAALGLAADQAGSVYFCSGSGQVLRLSPTGTDYYSTNVASGIFGSCGIAVDSVGVVYIADGGNSRIMQELPGGNVSYIQRVVVTTGEVRPQGIAVDAKSNLFFSDPSGARILELAQTGINFGSLDLGKASSSISLLFYFDSGGTIAAPSAVTQGTANLDFGDAGTGSCTINGPAHVYSAGDTCSVDVVFTPKAPGGRYGAAVLSNNSGKTIANGYVQGIGVGPAVSFASGSLIQLSLPGVTSPTQIAADTLGNLYVIQALGAFNPGNAIFKETWTGSGYVQSTIGTNLAYPLNIAVDGGGNVYVLDEGAYQIFKYSPNPDGTYTRSAFDTANGNTTALSVDGSGNVYFANGFSSDSGTVQIDSPAGGYYGHRLLNPGTRVNAIAVDAWGDIYLATGLQQVLKETPSNGSYIQSSVVGNFGYAGLAVDNVGNVYLAQSAIYKESPSGGSYIQTTLSYFNGANGLAVDGAGNVYFTSTANGAVWELGYSQSQALHFAATSVGSTSSDSPQTATIQNSGNATLNFLIPGTGYNPSLPSGFTLRDSLPSDCPVVSASSGTPGTLAAGATCNLAVSYSPQSASDLSGWMTVTDDALNAAAPNYTSQPIALAVAGHPLTPTITWAAPATISYGTALGAVQLNAISSLPGSFSYSPATGTVLGVGSHTLTTTFSPSDSTAYTTVVVSVTITVAQATPTITWPTPASITYGTALSSTQLNASTPVAGTFTYSVAAGTIPNAGSLTLTATFTPADTFDYTGASSSVTLVVNQVTPTIIWPAPASITYGTPLSDTQLNATASVPGSFTYSPAAGTMLTAYSHTLTATFTPTDTTNYKTVTASTNLYVSQASTTITWTTPAPITYGTPLSASQLNATASVPGSFSYNYPVGYPLRAGTYALTASFSPNDYINYSYANATVYLVVNKATPTLAWSTPAAITYGTALSGVQLKATASTGGIFVYSPAAGTVLNVGQHTITATFSPTDQQDFNALGTVSVNLQVNQAAPSITWATPAAIPYGTALGAAQLNASSTVAGTFSYSPAAGSVLGVGQQTITATFTPTDTTNYVVTSKVVTLTVNQATPTLTWPTPAAITYGTALGAAQLSANSAVAGSISYSPAAGTVLSAGSHVLTATFTPADLADYTTATASTTIVVVPVAPTIAWETPSAITYGTALSVAQLNARSPVPGTFVYTPAIGSVLGAGLQTLTANFTPTDSTNYTGAAASVTLVVSKVSPSITWATPAAITYGTALGAAQLNASSPIAGSFAYSPVPGTVLNAGSQNLAVTFTPNDAADYNIVAASVILTVGKAAPGITLVPSANPAYVSNAVTFTATLAATGGSPTGSVLFSDGTTLLGTVPVASGTAAYTTSALIAGTHTVTAVYSGDSNVLSVTSAALSEVVEDFSIAPSSGGSGSSTSATTSPGGQAIFTLAFNPPSAQTFPAPISLTVSGLPAGATATFSPALIPAGAGATNVTLTVALPARVTMVPVRRPFDGGALPIALGLILLPFWGGVRRTSQRLSRLICYIAMAVGGTALITGLSGCGGSSSQPPQNYTLTVTASSGSLSHTTTLNLTVQ